LTFDFQVMVQSAKEDLRPTIPGTCPPLFRNLITSCWHKAQEERPPMDAILETMIAIEKEYKANTQEWEAQRKL